MFLSGGFNLNVLQQIQALRNPNTYKKLQNNNNSTNDPNSNTKLGNGVMNDKKYKSW